MSNMSFEQATPVTADASGTVDETVEQQAQGGVKQENERDVTQILQKRVDDSQAFIKKLQADMAAMRAELDKSRKIEDALSSMEDKQVRQEPTQEKQSSLDADALIKKAKEETLAELRQAKEQEQRQENFKFVAASLAESLGRDGLDDKIKEVASENDMTFQEAVVLAQTKPKAFLKLFGVSSEQKPSQTSFKSSVNSQSFVSPSKAEKLPEFNPNNLKSAVAWANARAKQIAKSQQ